MDKITIKPDSREVVLRGKPEDGHSDVFSYNYEGSESNGLGSLFIVGHVQPATENTSYMVNLVASLAKREYYAETDLVPKEAFSKSLKKINEVLQEFFKNKDLRVNIGIFAIAGDNIFISRLGKFKIVLARNKQDIDILNNINLFNKEHIQDKEFSNIVSGKIAPQDKIFAFYPARSVVAREKNIKANLVALEGEGFIQKIKTIKQNNDSFWCAGIHITIDRHKEPAVVEMPQPQELRKAMANHEKPKVGIKLVSTNIPEIRSDETDQNKDQKIKTAGNTGSPDNQKDTPSNMDKPNKDNELQQKDSISTTPLIIPSEFSSAKKDNFFEKIISKFRLFRKSSSGNRFRNSSSMNFKKYAVYGLPILVLLIIGAWAVKSFLLLSPEEKELRVVTRQAGEKLKLAEEKITNNDLAAARSLLLSSLAAYSIPEINQNFISLLDKIDNAISTQLSVIDSLPNELAIKAAALSFENQKIESGKYELSSNSVGLDIYQDNSYILTSDQIFKVTDGIKSSTKAVAWLAANVTLVADAQSITVDGNVYVLNRSGVIIKYYKGEEDKRLNTSIVSDNSLLITAKDLPNLYLINKKLGRAYLIDKESGSIVKVLKIGNSEPLSNAHVDNDGTLYVVSADNKIWKVMP